MNENKLSCCVVRDLLPSYVEELTESETSELVREHLDSCTECKKAEEEMRSQLGIEHAPAPKLGFLRRYRTRQLLSALLAALVTAAVMCLLYSSEFKYQDTEAGRLAAVEDFVTQDMPAPYSGEEPPKLVTGTPLTVHAWAEYEDRLYLFYTADTEDNIQGFVELERGINGRYRPLDSIVAPSKETAGVAGYFSREKGVYLLAVYNCRGIHFADLSFNACRDDMDSPIVKNISIWTADSLRIMSMPDLLSYIDANPEEFDYAYLYSATLFDSEGKDVTSKYTDESVDQSWTGGVSAAETGAVYVFMAIAAILGIILVRFFLKKS